MTLFPIILTASDEVEQPKNVPIEILKNAS